VLRAEMSRATRYGRPLSVMMIDVDGFKGFNDTYGHPQGDVLLRLMATLLRTNTRSVDHVGRYGGEEFLVILPETTSEDAYYLAERMRHVIETAGFPTGRDESVVMTVSVGVASFPEDAANAGDLVQRADEAMYQAKRSGKNRVLTA
jgi:diguanylate cyclase (GGDEF)-like protein